MERRRGEYAPGRAGQAAAFDGKRYVEVGNVANFGFYDSFTLSAWIYPTAADGRDRQPRAGRAPKARASALPERWPSAGATWCSAGWTTARAWKAKRRCR